MRAILLLLALAAPTASLAQPAPLIPAPRHLPAPWWMDQPVLASSGFYETQLPANQASFTAQIQSVDKSLVKATEMSSEKIRVLTAQMVAFGADRVRVKVNFEVHPIYDQYRDRAGQLISNQRADKIERYEVEVEISVEVIDLAVLEQAYATVLAAQPNNVTEVEFRLEPSNATTTELFQQAVADARARAALSVSATGAQLGAVRLIDPSGQACVADTLLAGRPIVSEVVMQSSMARKRSATAVDSITAEDIARMRAEDLRVPLQPPMITLTSRACVVYGLSN